MAKEHVWIFETLADRHDDYLAGPDGWRPCGSGIVHTDSIRTHLELPGQNWHHWSILSAYVENGEMVIVVHDIADQADVKTGQLRRFRRRL